MPGVAVLPPPSLRLAGYGPDTRRDNGTYLSRQSINPLVNSPTMQNGSSTLGTVSEIKNHATKLAEQNSKGVSATALIGSARSQIQRGQLEDAAGNSKAALRAFCIAAALAALAQKAIEGNKINHEFLHFFQEEMAALNRIKTLETQLRDLERSTSAGSPHQDERPNVKVGNLVADRLKMLGQNGVVDPATKRYSRELPAGTTPSPFMQDTVRPNRPLSMSGTLVLSTASSASSSATTSPHAVVPPSSLGPPSPTSSDSSSPRLSVFAPSISEVAHNFPSIDELNEMESVDFQLPSVPRIHPTGSSISSRRSSISRSQSNGTGELAALSTMRSFPVLSVDPGPRPASTPITPIANSFISHPGSPLPKPPLGPSPLSPPLMHPIPEYPMPSPFIEKKALPSMLGMPGVDKRILSEKPVIRRSMTVTPKELDDYIRHGVTTLFIDIRTREAFEKEHIRGDPIICLEPSVILRSSLNVQTLENSLSVSEATLFKNRDKFDIVVIYDDSSTTHGDGPLSNFATIVYEKAFTTVLRNPPMLLLGGLKAWREEMGVDQVEFGAGGNDGVNGVDIPRAETTLGGPSASQLSSHFWTPATTNGAFPSPPERQFLETRSDSPVLSHKYDSETVNDARASISHRNALAHTSSSISYSYSHSNNTPQTPPVIAHSLANGSAVTSTSIQYPTFSNTRSPHVSRPGGTPLFSQPPAIPPQASINPSPLVRRRSDYVESGTSAGSFSSRRPIDYPDLPSNSQVLRPPPPVASSSFQRQHSHSQSYSVNALKEPPKPPTIPSTYPVTYWSDMQIVTAGLKNLGNTCYMNATIQCLSATVPFARFFTDGRWKNAVNAINPMGTQGRLASAFANILYEMSHSELPHLTPTTFRKSICAHAPQFSGADQHDSQEFLTFLLDGLHEDLNRVLHKPSNGSTPEREAELERLPQSIASTQEWEIYRMRNDSLIVDFFQGQFRNRLECLTCHKTSTTYNSFMYLSLPMPSLKAPSKTSLQSCLDAFVKEEVLAGSEAWHCPHCKILRKATKQLSLSRLPPILLIHLKRFSHKGVFTDKIETVVDFPLKGLDLTNYMPPALPPGVHKGPMNGIDADDPRVQTPPYKYDLYGVTNHFGSLSNGHYTAFIASRGGWVYCDDSRVTPTDAKEVVGRPAYVLYYKRIKS